MTEYKNRIPLLFQCLLWIIPLNIYVIGDWVGTGIQWAVFRYQHAFYNNEIVTSMFFFNREIQWILSSTITGKSVISIILWGVGITLLCAATLLIIYATIQENEMYILWGALLNIAGACAFSAAIINLYGITLQGPAGIVIPFGIPVILGVAYLQYRWDFELFDDKDSDETDNENLKNS